MQVCTPDEPETHALMAMGSYTRPPTVTVVSGAIGVGCGVNVTGAPAVAVITGILVGAVGRKDGSAPGTNSVAVAVGPSDDPVGGNGCNPALHTAVYVAPSSGTTGPLA